MAQLKPRRPCVCQSGVERAPCPCCGYLTLIASYGTAEDAICQVCFWQHDHVCEANPDIGPLGPNKVSLKQARANFRSFGADAEEHLSHVRAPRPDEHPSATP